MHTTTVQNNKRIAKNTLFLYLRTMLVMVISLFTSRIVLNTLGVDDFGIYNIIGGVVAMFSVISGSLSSSISRFITYELGTENSHKLNTIFCTSVNIQIGMSLLVLLIGEIIGFWFLNYKLNIPPDRLYAANWVLQFSLLSFVINLISVPYNSAIIAHEKMSAFAYVSIIEVSLKLIIVYMLYISPIDKLISYSLLLVGVALIIRIIYGIYCSKHFEECHYHFVYDKATVRQMTGFAGWSFFSNSAFIFNTQGVNILINLFFGVAVNAARGISTQVESAVIKFVSDFTTAVNPQITKSYAAGEYMNMFNLMCRGSKFSFFLMFCLALPLLLEAPLILELWLKIVPEHTVAFFRLSMIGNMCNLLGNTSYTACMATGRIKKYVIIVTIIGCLVFPITWLLFSVGLPVESTYFVFIFIYTALVFVRLNLLKGMINNFPVMLFINGVVLKVLEVSVAASILPLATIYFMPQSILRLFITVTISLLSSITVIYSIGINGTEREFVNTKIHVAINKLFNRK